MQLPNKENESRKPEDYGWHQHKRVNEHSAPATIELAVNYHESKDYEAPNSAAHCGIIPANTESVPT